jgi:hypothetical protein
MGGGEGGVEGRARVFIGGEGCGVSVRGSADVCVSDCLFFQCGVGVIMRDASRVRL